jgi:AhpD family alkylhydroperoxidase
VNLAKVGTGGLEALLGLERYLAQCGLEPRLMHLIKLRASVINGCTFCVDMHARDARLAGEPERRVHAVAAFEESPLFDDKEKAALAWADALTRIATTHAPDEAWERLRRHFSEKEAADLTWLIGAINLWNRVSIGTRVQPPEEWPKLPV